MTENGSSMIEVLVALTIVAFGMLGLLGLQARALSTQTDAFHRRQAAELVAQLAERMRANHPAFMAGSYSLRFDVAANPPEAVPACIGPCTSVQLAAHDLYQWRVELRRRIPGAAAYVERDASGLRGMNVSVAWPEPLPTGNDDGCEALSAIGALIPAGYRCYRAQVFP